MHYFFLDASALTKRYAPEPGAGVVHHLFAKLTPDRFVVLNVGIAEVASILNRKRNAQIISSATYAQAMLDFRAEVIGEKLLRKIPTPTMLVMAALPLSSSTPSTPLTPFCCVRRLIWPPACG